MSVPYVAFSTQNLVEDEQQQQELQAQQQQSQASIFFITQEDLQRQQQRLQQDAPQTQQQHEPDRRVQVFQAERSKLEYVPYGACMLIVFFIILVVILSRFYGINLFTPIYEYHPTHATIGTTPFYNGTIPMPASCGISSIKPHLEDQNLALEKQRKKRHSISTRIINGKEAMPHSWPWMVSLRRSISFGHFCDGFLVYEQYVLTAAHCVEDKSPSSIVIMAGLHELDPADTEGIYRDLIFDVEKIFVNEMYDTVNIEYDIALIKLSRKIVPSEKVGIVCLPESPAYANEVYDKSLITAGWGRIDKDTSNVLALTLQETILKVINGHSACNNPNYNSAIIYCTLDPNDGRSNACNGDSGSPLFVMKNNRWYAYGIVSYITGRSSGGGTVCITSSPSYFTKIALHINWIASKVAMG